MKKQECYIDIIAEKINRENVIKINDYFTITKVTTDFTSYMFDYHSEHRCFHSYNEMRKFVESRFIMLNNYHLPMNKNEFLR